MGHPSFGTYVRTLVQGGAWRNTNRVQEDANEVHGDGLDSATGSKAAQREARRPSIVHASRSHGDRDRVRSIWTMGLLRKTACTITVIDTMLKGRIEGLERH